VKPRYKTGDRVSYKGKVFRVVRTVMERTGTECDLGDEAGREVGLRIAEDKLQLVEEKKGVSRGSAGR